MEIKAVVSIITPAYNAEKYIAEAIESVLNQTFEAWELIVIDDGSTDNTAKIVSSFEDDRIIFIGQKNKGVSSARNRGLILARGKYITFLDADDVLPLNSVELRVNYLENYQEINMVHGEIIIVREDINNPILILKTFSYDNLLKKVLHLDKRLSFNIGYMIRSDEIQELQFNEKMSHAEDILFLLELCVNKMEYAYIPKPMYYYYERKNSAMSNLEGWRKGYLELLDSINGFSKISYFDTLVMRIKIMRMLISWHLKEKYIWGILDIFRIMRFK